MFSAITSKLHAESNAFYRLRDEIVAQGQAIRDLVSGAINEQGFVYPQDILAEALATAVDRCRVYRPDSFGQRSAREAVSRWYAERSTSIPAEQILITPGTSISYWYAFKLLADEGDEILCPCPSYPLFDYIALLCGVKLIPYRLDESRDWRIDMEQLEASISTRTRALVLISPHNPTGHVASAEEIAEMAEVARRHDLAIISDEVFSEFLFESDSLPRAVGSRAPLVLTLNGFSKMFALPGLKFGWMGVSGDDDRVRQALRALELISDTFLPVNEIVQAAASVIFDRGREFQREFADRVRNCWETAESFLSRAREFQYVRPRGGFYVSLRLNRLEEEAAAEGILRENHTLVHPGYFYDMPPDHLILCFAQAPEAIRESYPGWIATLDRLAHR